MNYKLTATVVLSVSVGLWLGRSLPPEPVEAAKVEIVYGKDCASVTLIEANNWVVQDEFIPLQRKDLESEYAAGRRVFIEEKLFWPEHFRPDDGISIHDSDIWKEGQLQVTNVGPASKWLISGTVFHSNEVTCYSPNMIMSNSEFGMMQSSS